MMEVILKRDVPNVGRMGELVRVKNGFGRNYLLPRSLAVLADRGNKISLEHHQRLIEKEKIKVKLESEEIAKEIAKVKITLKKRFNDQKKMFGSVASSELVTELKSKGFSVDRRDLELPDMTDAGTYSVKLRLPGDVYTQFDLKIQALVDTEAKEKKTRAPKKAKTADEAAVAEAEGTSEKLESPSTES